MDQNNQKDANVSASPLKRFNSQLMNVRTQEYLDMVLGNKKETFINNIVAVVANNTQLQDCEPMSVVFAALKATALDLPLDPNLGFAHLIPYKTTASITNPETGAVTKVQKKLAQLQFGYRAFIQLGQRTGRISLMNVVDIRDGEYKGRNLLTGEYRFEEVPDRESKRIVGYAAYFALTNGFSKADFMTVEEAEKHAKRYSQTYRSQYEKVRAESKWTTDFDAMAEKTVLKRLLAKWAPLSAQDMSQLGAAIKQDQMVFDDRGNGAYLDNPEREAEYQDQESFEKAVDQMKGGLRERKASGKAEDVNDMP